MPSSTTPLHTFHDAIDHLLDHFGGVEQGRNVKMAKRAIFAAYRALPAVYNWSYYYKRGRISSVAAYTTGTVTYDHTGGANERIVTLVGGTWPSWAANGILRIGSIDYVVDTRVSDTVLVLSINSNPGDDVTTASSYTLARDSYPLPIDFQSADQLRNATKNWTWPSYVAPGTWLDAHRSLESANDPRIYTIMADANFLGTMAVYFYPPPTSASDFDFLYQRVPIALRVADYKTGTVSTSAGSKVITGKGTSFSGDMKGSVIRIGSGTNHPSGLEGLDPFSEQRVIVSVDSETQVTVDTVLANSAGDAKYRVSDYLDIEEGAMFEAFMAYCELRLSMLLKDDDIPLKEDIYTGALRQAMQADNRSFGDSEGRPYSHIAHLRDWATVTPNA